VLELLGRKTRECDELAGAVEHAREAGMDPSDPRLHRAEEALAERYAEVKEIAGLAYKLGLAVRDDDEEEEEEEGDDEEDDDDEEEDEKRAAAEEAGYRAIVSLNPAQRAALDNVRGLESELQACVAELGQVEASSSPAVVRHPAFLRIRADVKGHLEALKVPVLCSWAAGLAGGRSLPASHHHGEHRARRPVRAQLEAAQCGSGGILLRRTPRPLSPLASPPSGPAGGCARALRVRDVAGTRPR